MTLESTVLNLIEKPLKALGYSEVDVKFVNEFGTNYLRVMVDKDDEVIDLDEIMKVNDIVSPLLDEADLIKTNYVLDVTTFGSVAGMEMTPPGYSDLRDQANPWTNPNQKLWVCNLLQEMNWWD